MTAAIAEEERRGRSLRFEEEGEHQRGGAETGIRVTYR